MVQNGLKYKNEIRKDLSEKIAGQKNIVLLRQLQSVVNLICYAGDEEKCICLSDCDWDRLSIIRNALTCEDEGKIKKMQTFVRSICFNSRKKGCKIR